MNDKTILARLRRRWNGQEKDRIIWNQGILPNFISPNGEYKPISFTCYQLYKILQESFSYQNLYKHLKKYEMEGFLISKLITNKNNRKERIYSFSEKTLRWGCYRIKYILNNHEKIKAQKLFELLQDYNHPKKIYDNYIKKKISKSNALNTLQYIIDLGSMFENHQLESSFLLNVFKYFVRLSKKDKKLFSYLEEVAISHEKLKLQKKAFDYILKYFPDSPIKNLSRKFTETSYLYFSKAKNLHDYMLTNGDYSLYRLFRSTKNSLKELKDQKLLDFHILAQEKLKKYRIYIQMLSYGDYDPLINCMVYNWSHIRVVYKKIKNFEQEPYKIILSANLRNQNNDFWRLTDRNFYFVLKIFNTVLKIKEQDIFVAFPPLHKSERGGMRYKSPIKIFSEKTDFIVYLQR